MDSGVPSEVRFGRLGKLTRAAWQEFTHDPHYAQTYQNAYEAGVLGQTVNAAPEIKWTTRIALGISAGAMALVGVLEAAAAMGVTSIGVVPLSEIGTTFVAELHVFLATGSLTPAATQRAMEAEEGFVVPAQSDANLYRYCGNSPANGTDPTGMWDNSGGGGTWPDEMRNMKYLLAGGQWVEIDADGTESACDAPYMAGGAPATLAGRVLDATGRTFYFASQMRESPCSPIQNFVHVATISDEELDSCLTPAGIEVIADSPLAERLLRAIPTPLWAGFGWFRGKFVARGGELVRRSPSQRRVPRC